jgi:hypothetical protein
LIIERQRDKEFCAFVLAVFEPQRHKEDKGFE